MRFALLVCVVLVGCSGTPGVDAGTGGGSGGGGGAGGGGGTTTLTLAQFCQQRESTVCAAGVTCGVWETAAGCAAAQERNRLDYASLDDCAVGQAAVADGRASFDATAAGDCFAAAASSCQAYVASSTCSGVFRPLVTQGGNCFDDRECAVGTFCQKGLACPGTCVARVPAGQQQGNGERCLEGLYTAFESPPDGGLGLLLVCRPLVAAGQPCGNPTACVAGLTCRADGTCGTPRATGAACKVTDAGVLGGIVVSQDCELFHACQPIADGGFACAALGNTGDRCGLCKADLRCLDGHCAPRGTTSQPCASINDCALGFYCQPTGALPLGPGLCQPRQAEGSRCVAASDCARGLGCVTQPPTDGGFFPEGRCSTVDAGLPCADRTP